VDGLIFELLTSAVMGSVAGYGYLKTNGMTNDAAKLQRIFKNCGLVVVEKKKDERITREVQLYRRAKLTNEEKKVIGTEYVYRIPLGLSFNDFEQRIDNIRDGLNNKKLVFDFNALKGLDFNENIPKQIKDIREKKKRIQKDTELSFDGMLHVKVFDQGIPEKIDFQHLSKGWEVLIGNTHHEKVFHNFDKFPHMVMGGATTYGKSTLANLIINCLLLQKPNNVTFTLIDLKGGAEFGDYQNLKQVVGYAEEPEDAEEVLKEAYELMIKKRDEIKKKGFKNVKKAKVPHRHFVIIDEVGELNPDEAVTKEEKRIKENCQVYMSKIARLGASWGFRQILATQYGTGDIIPRQCKQNSDAKICFRVQTGVASKVVLDNVGAEELPRIPGRSIYQMPDRSVIMQSPLITEEQIQEIIKPHLVRKEVKREPERVPDIVEFEEV
jgi:DNA segregation ATPase FtsK/SpoIIIE, S-DNA-T family